MTDDIPALRQQLTDAGLTHGPMHEALDELERTRAARDSFRAVLEGASYGNIDAIAAQGADTSRALGEAVQALTLQGFARRERQTAAAEADRDRLAGELAEARAALIWARDRIAVDGGMTPAEAARTASELLSVLRGAPSPASSFVPDPLFSPTAAALKGATP